MLRCPTCSHDNDDFATVCANCKSFLQNRVPNLNLFETAWGIIEAPRRTFRTIVLAEHKNFSVFLFLCFGIALSFTAFWFFRLGTLFDTLLDLIPWAVTAGIAIAMVAAPVLTLVYHAVTKIWGSRLRLRNSFALLAYALVPVAATLVLVLPIELLTFGMYLFTANPHPWVIKPVSYAMLVAFDSAMSLWSIVLVIQGTRVAHRLSIGKSLATVGVLLGVLSGMFFTGIPYMIDLFKNAGTMQ